MCAAVIGAVVVIMRRVPMPLVVRMKAFDADKARAIERGTGDEAGRVSVPGRIAAVIFIWIGISGIGRRRLRHRAAG
jgi:hypothetical protein